MLSFTPRSLYSRRKKPPVASAEFADWAPETGLEAVARRINSLH
jgi:hypothetical protein